MKPKTKSIMIWISRIISGIVIGFYGIFIVGEGFSGTTPIWSIKDPTEAIMVALMVASIIALVVGWFKPIWGGIFAILLIAMFLIVDNQSILSVKAIPFLIVPFAGLVQLVVGVLTLNKHSQKR